ncbi:MAG: hypothetical protein MHPSP_004010, partial [Paramarteilia canceri]
KLHKYQDDGSFKQTEDVEPYSFEEIAEQQNIILNYEYQKSKLSEPITNDGKYFCYLKIFI